MSSPQSSYSPTSSTTSSETHPTTSRPGRRTRVTAEHTLSRVRENQRRHRARRKDYIASLEQKLAETEDQLAAARAEIAALRKEKEAHTTECRKDSMIQEELVAGAGVQETTSAPYTSLEAFSLSTLPEASSSSAFPIDFPLEIAIPAPPLTGPPPCCNDPVPPLSNAQAEIQAPAPAMSPECSTCHTRPLALAH
ncbi:hypothetical protein N0V90_005252 [Kalmusia sp. IMI 367209]|nr:hypothetical protein N0V90_005252 [Kalmusia sp. IMI 367209]